MHAIGQAHRPTCRHLAKPSTVQNAKTMTSLASSARARQLRLKTFKQARLTSAWLLLSFFAAD